LLVRGRSHDQHPRTVADARRKTITNGNNDHEQLDIGRMGRGCRTVPWAVRHRVPWAVRHDLLAANPIDKIDAVKVPNSLPRPAPADDLARVLGAILNRQPRKDVPLARLRDRMLFETAYGCGARASEVGGLYVEDLDLRLDDENVRIHGKGGTGTAGPLFRASING
jgi:site-specific recombinase XerC